VHGKRPTAAVVSLVIAMTVASGCVIPQCPEPPALMQRWWSGVLRSDSDRPDLDTYLTKHPKTVNTRYYRKCETALHAAARLGRDDLVSVLIAKGADLRALDGGGLTPLGRAAWFRRVNVVTLLVKSGAPVNASRPTEQPPLYAAIGNSEFGDVESQLETMKVLLAAGADVNSRGLDDRTVLIRAVMGGSRNQRLIELLIERGADVRARDKQGSPVLALAVGAGRDTVKLLLDRGARTDIRDTVYGGTALGWAVHCEQPEIADELRSRGAPASN
jgi:ankyrin repeat protein